MSGGKTVVYEFETVATPIVNAETAKYLRENTAHVVSVSELAGACAESETQREAMLIAKYSDKKMKGKTKTIAKMEKKIDKTRRPRYYVPLIFTTPEKKTIIRRLKVMDVRDDKRFTLGAQSESWTKAYGEMILCSVSVTPSGVVVFQRNPLFSLETFRKCGGILNAKFWDINMRYGASVINCGESESQWLVLSAIAKELVGD